MIHKREKYNSWKKERIGKEFLKNISKNGHYSTLYQYEKYKVVMLRRKELNSLPDQATYLKRTKTLDISYNNIKTIPTEKLKKMPNLEMVVLTHNPLSEKEKERAYKSLRKTGIELEFFI